MLGVWNSIYFRRFDREEKVHESSGEEQDDETTEVHRSQLIARCHNL